MSGRIGTSKIAKGLGLTLLVGVGISAISSSRRAAVGNDDGRDRTVVLTYEFTIKQIPRSARELRFWVPLPANDKHQRLHSSHLEGAPAAQLVADATYGNRYLWAKLPVSDLSGKETATFALTATVTRRAYRVWDHASQPIELSPALRRRFLAPNRLVPINGRIAAEAKRVAGDAASPLTRARRLYDHIVDSLRYDTSGDGWGQGDAVYACDLRTGNCTDFHSLFIAEARALSIPARFVIGLPLPPDKHLGSFSGYHCWSEFYLEGIGWVPIDASEANKHPEKREFFFGGLDQHRIAFTTGRDVALPHAAGAPLNYSIYPHVELDGKEHPFVETKFTFRNIDTGSAPAPDDA